MEYQARVREMLQVPVLSHRHAMLRRDGGPNRLFITFLFGNPPLAIEFLKKVGLLRAKMPCKSCGQDFTWSTDSRSSDGFRWRCNRRVAGNRCNNSASIRRGSLFQRSKLTLLEIMLITYDIVHREKAPHVLQEYPICDHTVADWGMFCREAMQVFWRAALSRSVVLRRQLKLTRANSFGANITGAPC
jgi:hypothetical protein